MHDNPFIDKSFKFAIINDYYQITQNVLNMYVTPNCLPGQSRSLLLAQWGRLDQNWLRPSSPEKLYIVKSVYIFKVIFMLLV